MKHSLISWGEKIGYDCQQTNYKRYTEPCVNCSYSSFKNRIHLFLLVSAKLNLYILYIFLHACSLCDGLLHITCQTFHRFLSVFSSLCKTYVCVFLTATFDGLCYRSLRSNEIRVLSDFVFSEYSALERLWVFLCCHPCVFVFSLSVSGQFSF